ncbi:flagellar hook-length control protein FliK [Modestobacter italicus]|uniref:flagellar hook-length control protein FliK n=1 Tax=Modestobacter italicus (strain DSM 44449 / CECT 9708 / BC 501) TaxID=2732864 RepID=UPI001C95A508|nr:flagellar hook-length control protein FliK [Modestobacter italicus]
MTAPTSMPVMPAVARAGAPSSTASPSGDGSPAFADALDTALDDTLSGGGKAAGGSPTDPEQSDAATAEDAAAPAPVVLVPGLWALMTAVNPLTTSAAGTAATTAAASLIGAVTGVAVPPLPGAPTTEVAVPGATAPGVTAPGADQLLASVDPAPTGTAVPAPAATAADVLADAAGLTVVRDPAPAAGPLSAEPAVVAGGVLPPAAGAAGSADAGTDGATGGAAGAVPAAAADAPQDADAVFTLGGATANATVGAAAEVTPAPAPLPDDAPVAAQLGRQIAVLRNAPDGSQTMTLVITPEDLGPVTVSVTATAGTLDLTLHGSSELGRHALLDALPDLRRDLEGAGLSLSKLDVGTSTDGGSGSRAAQQLLDARAGHQGSSGQPGQQAPRTWGSVPDAVAADGTPLTTDQSTSPGVDVRV